MMSLGVLASLGGCGVGDHSSVIAYRMTVEVETPEGLRSGSSVLRVETRTGRRFGDSSGIKRRIRIEAVAVRLPSGILFAVPQNAAGADYAAYLLLHGLERGLAVPRLSRAYGGGEWLEMEAEARRVKPRITLDPRDYPTLVRFKDLADPRTIEQVDPSDLQQSFGRGVRLRRIEIAVTDEQPTAGIVKFLPWLPEYQEKTLLGNRYGKPGVLADELGAASFTTELGK